MAGLVAGGAGVGVGVGIMGGKAGVGVLVGGSAALGVGVSTAIGGGQSALVGVRWVLLWGLQAEKATEINKHSSKKTDIFLLLAIK